MAIAEHLAPMDVAADLARSDSVILASSNWSVSLSYAAGVFVMSWSATNIDSYDWVALYRNINAADTDYVTYQWASKGPSYTTSQVLTAGYQARYLVYNSVTKAYQSVVRTDPFPVVRICSQ